MLENWRAKEENVDAIAAARQKDPFAVLGPHLTDDGWAIRAFVTDAPIKHTSLSTGAEGLLSDNPLKRLALAALFVCSYFRMHKHSDCADQPMLPFVRDDHGDAFHLLLVALYESSMILESRDILPTGEFGSVNQQSNLPMLPDERINLRPNLKEVEPRRVCRRLQLLRGWSHGNEEDDEEGVFARGSGTRGSHGSRASGRSCFAMGCDLIDCGQDRLHGGDAAFVGAAVGA